MIEIGNTLVTDDVINEEFVCDLTKCKGACCVEGDLGAPLEEAETKILEDIYSEVEPYLTDAGKEVIQEVGTFVPDEWDGHATPLVNGKECAYVFYDENKILKCGIDQAYQDGKIDYKKPLSCHLYPVRLTQLASLTAVNYDRWSICADACTLGKSLKVPVYKFLKEPLVRKFGATWYSELEKKVEEER